MAKSEHVSTMRMTREMHARQMHSLEETPLPPKLIANREWLANPDHWPIFRQLQRQRITYPGNVHIEALIGTSRTGKTKIGGDLSGATEADKKGKEELNKSELAQSLTPDGEREFLEIEIPLGDSQTAVAKSLGKTKAELTKDEMRLGAQKQLQAIQVLVQEFTNHPKYTVGVKLETVANTTTKEADRGTSTVTFLQFYPFLNNLILEADAEVETRAAAARHYVRTHPDSPALNVILKNFGILDARIQGRAVAFTDSCGQEEHWIAQQRDIYEQIANAPKKDLFFEFHQPPFELFIDPSFQRQRIRMYNLWMQNEGKEAFAADKVIFIPNPFIPVGVHYDDERFLGSKKKKPRVFPFDLLQNPVSKITSEDILERLELR